MSTEGMLITDMQRQEELLKSHFFTIVGQDVNVRGAILYATKEEALAVAQEKLQQNPTRKYYILESVACVKCDFPVTVVDMKKEKEVDK